jgi:acetyl-CoA carboxylase biotin carboxylase subunit
LCIGPPPSKESYLNIPALLSAAEVSGADAIHPGYGFLSENAEFAEMVQHSGLGWIGPRPEMIRLMGNKVRAKEAMRDAGLPQLPGSDGVVTDERDLVRLAEKVGFPVILKAAAGGGGRGMKIVRDKEQLAPMFRTASAEAMAAFGNGDMYVERYVEHPRHIEIQIVADEHGNVIHLGERECSIQRRHQKMLEESPSPALNERLRERMGRVAVEAMRKVRYNNLGTIEFLLDERGEFFFMEMNTRIQVEHPVTESVTGIDLVREQIRLSAGEDLGRTQKSIALRGHAIEMRINAEDPTTFAPSPGLISAYHAPGGLGVRVDSVVYEQYRVLPYYDSMVAKLIVSADSRPAAIMRARRALQEYVVEGIKTNIAFHRRLLQFEPFVQGRYDTRSVERLLAESVPSA